MNIEKSLEIVKGKLLMIKKLLKNDEENGHSSSYEMQKEDFEAIETLLIAYEKEKNKELEAVNLIEKQSKEIEEYKKQLDLDYVDNHFVPIERYNQLEKEIEELKEKNSTLKNLQNDTNRLYIEMIERKGITKIGRQNKTYKKSLEKCERS